MEVWFDDLLRLGLPGLMLNIELLECMGLLVGRKTDKIAIHLWTALICQLTKRRAKLIRCTNPLLSDISWRLSRNLPFTGIMRGVSLICSEPRPYKALVVNIKLQNTTAKLLRAEDLNHLKVNRGVS